MEITLVTGATGLVGFNIVQALLRRERHVRVLVRSLDKGRALLPSTCELVLGDVTDEVSIQQAMAGCSVVYHAAGLPEQWLPDSTAFHKVNVGGTQNMIAAALAQGVRHFIYTSTIDVFAAETGEVYDESVLASKSLATFYERSKQTADQHVVAALEQGLPAVFLHPAAVYGPGPAGSPGFNHAILQLQQGQVPALPPGGLPLVYAPDVGEGHVLAEEKATVGSRYILGGAYYSLTKLAEAVLAESGREKKVPPVLPLFLAQLMATVGEWVSQFTHNPPLIAKGALHFMQWQAQPNSQKAQQELGWSPTPLRQGLKQTIAYLSQNAST